MEMHQRCVIYISEKTSVFAAFIYSTVNTNTSTVLFITPRFVNFRNKSLLLSLIRAKSFTSFTSLHNRIKIQH